MKRALTPALQKTVMVVGLICVFIGLGVMLLDYIQGIPFSVFSLTPVTMGMLAIAVSLRRRRSKTRI